MIIERSAWKCPGCGKWHGPHVDSCPEPVDAVSDRRYPSTNPVPNWTPIVGPTPISCGIGVYKPDPDHKMVYASARRPQDTSEPPRS